MLAREALLFDEDEEAADLAGEAMIRLVGEVGERGRQKSVAEL